MTTGSGGSDYTPQINSALAQANLPKSPLAQMFQNLMGGQASSLVNNMMNAQNFGNAAFQGFAPSPQPRYPTNPTDTNPNNGNGLFPTLPGVTGGSINPNTQYQFPQLGGGSGNPNIGDANPPAQGGMNPYNLSPSFSQAALNPPQPGNPVQVNPFTNEPVGGGSASTFINNNAGIPVPAAMPTPNAQPLQGIFNTMQFPTTQQAQGFNPGMFGNINQMAQQGLLNSPSVPQVNGMNPLLSMLSSGIFNQLPQIQNPALNFNNPFQGLNANIPQVNSQNTNVNNPSEQILNQLSGANTNAQSPQGINGLSDALTRALSGAGQVPTVQAGQVNLQNPDLSGIGQINPLGGADYQAIQNALQQKFTRDQQDLQAQFATGGNSRGTPAAFAQAELRAQQLPQLQQALTAAANANFQNQLGLHGLVQQGLLQNAAQSNQANLDLNAQGLQAALANAQNALSSNSNALNALLPSATTVRGQDIGNNQSNIQNMLQQMGLLSNTAANAGQFGLNQAQFNSGNNLQAQLANAQNALGLFGTQGNIAQAAGQLNLGQNQLASGNALQAQQNNIANLLSSLGLQNQAAQGAGELNLGQNQLGSQNSLQAQQLAGQNLNNLLGQQNTFLQNQGNYNLGLGNLFNQNNQFNAQQGNQMGLAYAGMNQQAIADQINRAFSGQQNLLGILAGMAGQGVPSGSANVNIGGQSYGGGGIGSTLGGIGSLLGAIASF